MNWIQFLLFGVVMSVVFLSWSWIEFRSQVNNKRRKEERIMATVTGSNSIVNGKDVLNKEFQYTNDGSTFLRCQRGKIELTRIELILFFKTPISIDKPNNNKIRSNAKFVFPLKKFAVRTRCFFFCFAFRSLNNNRCSARKFRRSIWRKNIRTTIEFIKENF